MGVFDDDKFGKLDWITQITETIESDLNTMLAKLPERYEFTYDELASNVSGSHMAISARYAIKDVCRSLPKNDYHRLSWEEEQLISSCYKLEASGDLLLDLVNKTFTGSVALVKKVATLEDEQLLKVMGERGITAIKRPPETDEAKTRMNEILDILEGDKETIKGKSTRNKFGEIRRRLAYIIRGNHWRIRDSGLADRLGYWIQAYIQTGNLAALTNLCKVKVMTHNNMPIYSIEEETYE
jgi:hypothetical protein